MKIYESGEDYLETILLLKEKKGIVHSVDIVEKLNFSKSSVSRAVNLLKDKGFITIENGVIEFTKYGLNYTINIYKKHVGITNFLVSIGVDRDVAESDACRIEHIISAESFKALMNYLEKIKE